MTKKTLCLLALLAFIPGTFAQDVRSNNVENSFWFTLGTGYLVPLNSLPVLYTNFTYDYNDNLFSLRYIMSREMKIASTSSNNPFEEVNDIGLLYGRLIAGRASSISFNCGISYISGIRRGREIISNELFRSEYEKIEVSTVGVPIELAVFITPFRYFGFGINVFGNMNIEQNYIGAGIYLTSGDIRKLQKVYSQYKARRDSLRILRRAAFDALPSDVKKRRKNSRVIFGLGTLGFTAASFISHLHAHSCEGAAEDYLERRNVSTTDEEYDKYDKMYKEEKKLIKRLRIRGTIGAACAAASNFGFILAFRF